MAKQFGEILLADLVHTVCMYIEIHLHMYIDINLLMRYSSDLM